MKKITVRQQGSAEQVLMSIIKKLRGGKTHIADQATREMREVARLGQNLVVMELR